jgi:hypothetical protein
MKPLFSCVRNAPLRCLIASPFCSPWIADLDPDALDFNDGIACSGFLPTTLHAHQECYEREALTIG